MEKIELREKIYSRIDELPTLPAMLPKLMNLMESNKASASDIADVISHDPSLASKILKVANSAYYGFSQKITSLEKAVPLLGFNMVRSLALSIGVINNLPSGKKLPNFSHDGLWLHSLAVAILMQEFGKKDEKEDERDYLFIVGLLHDIGKIILNYFFSEPFQKALEEAKSQEDTGLYMAERKVIGLDHGEVGAMLLARWRLPTAITNPIEVHHQVEIPEGTRPDDVAMLRISDALAQELELGETGNPVSPKLPEAEIEVLHLTEKELVDMKAYLHSIEDGIHAFFSAMS